MKMSEEEKKIENAEPSKASKEAELIAKLTAENERLAKENESLEDAKDRYYDVLLNHNEPKEEEAPKVVKSESMLRKEFSDLMATNPDNMTYVSKVVEMDDWYREHKGESIFLPKGPTVKVTADERATADRVHDAFVQCLENADGDPEQFDLEMKKICPDAFPDYEKRLKQLNK